MKLWAILFVLLLTCQSCIVYTQKIGYNKEQALLRVVEKKKRSKITFEKEGSITKQKYLLVQTVDEDYYGIRKEGLFSSKRDSLSRIENISLVEIKKVKTINPGISILANVVGYPFVYVGSAGLILAIIGFSL